MNNYGYQPYGGYPQYPYGYQSQMQRQGQMAMQQAQPPMPTMQQPIQQPVLPTLCYAKMEEAKPYIITNPNSSMLFIDREKNKALLKSTDNMCASYSRYFDISETDENGNPLQRQEPTAPQVDYANFVTKDQLNGLPTAEQYKELVAQYASLLDQVNNMKKIITGGKPNGNGTGTSNAKGN